jgi:hypothetical protein
MRRLYGRSGSEAVKAECEDSQAHQRLPASINRPINYALGTQLVRVAPSLTCRLLSRQSPI